MLDPWQIEMQHPGTRMRGVQLKFVWLWMIAVAPGDNTKHG